MPVIIFYFVCTESPTNCKLEVIENGQIYEAVDFEKAIELAGLYYV